jgi:hypothetical protein
MFGGANAIVLWFVANKAFYPTVTITTSDENV